MASAQPAPPVAAATSPYDRIAALSAVPLTQPPGPAEAREGGVMTELLATATTWTGLGGDYLRAHWREVGLIATMVILSGLLFWRLGERSRHADQELVLDFDAMPLVDEMAQEPAEEAGHEAVLDLAHETASAPLPVLELGELEPELEPEGLPLPAPAVSHREASMEDELVLEKRLPRYRFATLREAVEAMKADMADGDLARRPAVSA